MTMTQECTHRGRNVFDMNMARRYECPDCGAVLKDRDGLLGRMPFDRRILAQAIHAESVGAGGLGHCFHGTDGSECHYHADLIARQYERIFRERADYWMTPNLAQHRRHH